MPSWWARPSLSPFIVTNSRCRDLLEGILLSPLIIPHYTIGLGVLILASQTNVGRGFPLVIFAHVVMVLPFVMRSTYISLENLDTRLELAASSLGATPLRILFTVTIPLLIPGLLSGWLFAAILSFNEFTATLVRQQPGHADAAGRHV